MIVAVIFPFLTVTLEGDSTLALPDPPSSVTSTSYVPSSIPRLSAVSYLEAFFSSVLAPAKPDASPSAVSMLSYAKPESFIEVEFAPQPEIKAAVINPINAAVNLLFILISVI